jgi:DNA-binding NtrC family response regulator
MLSDSICLTAEDFSSILAVPDAASGPFPPTVANAAPVAAAPVAATAAAVKPLAQRLAEVEREAIQAALEASGGNKASAARALGISRATLYQKIVEYQLVSN